MVHKIHVDLNWQWEGDDPDKVFKLERRLGEGAYGVVHKAVQAETNFPLAIKIVNMTGAD
jgi:serine/threonine protein kinase